LSFATLLLAGNLMSQVAPWPMERQDRWGTGRALVSPPESTLTTPWLKYFFGGGDVVSHPPAIPSSGPGYFNQWTQDKVNKFDLQTGIPLMSFLASDFVQSAPAIGTGGTVFAAQVGNFSSNGR